MNASSEPGSSRFGALALSSPHCDISLQNPNRYAEVEAAALRPWLDELLAELVPEARSFAVRFVGDRAMKQLNLEYRGFDKSTDVLSFEGDLPKKGHFGKKSSKATRATKAEPAVPAFPVFEGDHLGDVVISVPKARRQAMELGHNTEQELRTLLLHGVLHCLGYDHEVDDGTMGRVEAELRLRFIGEMSFIEGSES